MRPLLSIVFILYGLLGTVAMGFVIDSLWTVLTNDAAQLSRGFVLLSLVEVVVGLLGIGSMVGFFTCKQWGRLLGVSLTGLIFVMISVNIIVVKFLRSPIETYSLTTLVFGFVFVGFLLAVLLSKQCGEIFHGKGEKKIGTRLIFDD